ncbi:MAG: Fpg/Nei family DNA glycosylase [Candidatus Eremiobacteraeota bacterium]|nr:Fpg/Nei family DNA glycosylase [Candidatus Eremiobacteraeota bacterium]MCW5870316.1 Fpg/Nei family DNA glycosylase [Candidatus Eremiobacteraeota bacterium]
MPEGDTVHKVARVLDQELRDQSLRRVELRGGVRPFAQATRIKSVHARGKHCLIVFDNGRTLRVHLGMHGSWHRYPQPWKNRGEVHLRLETEKEVFVCLQPKDVELLNAAEVAKHPILTELGPDLLAGEEPDWDWVQQRARQFCPPDRLLGEVLLDQRIAAGLGNVYKSELCLLGPLPEGKGNPFRPLAGTHPFSPSSVCRPEQLRDLFWRGRRLLQLNLGGWPRTTTHDASRPGPGNRARVWLYGRAGLGCLRCGTPIESRHQGLAARATFWCPKCQPLGAWKEFSSKRG